MIGARRPRAKASTKRASIDQGRKLGDRRRSDTFVVLTVNDTDRGLVDVTRMTPPAPKEKSSVFGFRGEYGRTEAHEERGRKLSGLEQGRHQEAEIR